MRRQNNHAPHHCGIAEDHRTHDTHRLAHAGRTACTVIIAQNRRSSLIHCIDRCLDELTHARYNRHNRDVNITAGHREYVVAADRDKAVGQLHDKSRGTEADNIFRIACTLRNFIFPHKAHFQFRFSGQEIQNEHGGKCLGNHSCNRSPLHTKAKYKDKQRVKQQVCDRSDRDGKHANGRVALRVDERVHAGCHHRRQSSDQINHHIRIRVYHRICRCTEQRQQWTGKQKADHHQYDSTDTYHGIRRIHNTFRLFLIILSTLNRKQRSAAASKQVAECCDDNDQRKTQTDCTECRRSYLRDPRDVDAVYNIVQQTQNLSNQHRERCPEDVSGYGSMFEINSFHLFPHSLLFHLLFSIAWRILYVNYCFYIEIK